MFLSVLEKINYLVLDNIVIGVRVVVITELLQS